MILSRRSCLVLLAVLVAGCDDAPPAPTPAEDRAAGPDQAVIRVVGTGAMTPLVAELARTWLARGGVPRVVVEPSVGSTGGVPATLDGAVDLGMVARPLSPEERARGLEEVPVARDAVVLAAHRDVSVESVTSSELEALFSGATTHFPDGGPAVVVLRDRSDSAHAALERMVPALLPLREQAYETHRFQVVFHDDTMGATLASSLGALGPFSLGAVVAWRLPLKVLALDGVAPSVGRIEDGTWKATRDLAFVLRADRRARVERFLEHVRSAESREAMRSWGYLPLTGSLP